MIKPNQSLKNSILFRLEKAKESKEGGKTKTDLDDYEDFGPLIEKIIDKMTSRRQRNRKDKQTQ